MEFKYMLVGDQFYGDKDMFQQNVKAEGENEEHMFKRMKTQKEKPNNAETTSMPCWQCNNYDNVID